MAPEAGAYSRDKMSDPAYKPPPMLSTNVKVAKRGAYMWDTTVLLKRGTMVVGINLQVLSSYATNSIYNMHF